MVSLVLLTGFLGLVLPADAEESWPSWRGSRGDGSSPDETVPLKWNCLLYTSPSPRDRTRSRMPSSA